MAKSKLYRIEFLARAVGEGSLPSSAVVSAAVENALKYIGVEPTGSKVESSEEHEIKEDA